jgi:penicillin amidase
VFCIVVVLAGYAYLRRSLPVVDGTVQIEGPGGPIDIIRDADGIPHIFATAKSDAGFGLGYVHAQDRLWQMEFQRRIGFGRLAEIFGPAAIPQDRFLRTIGFGRAARDAWDRLSAAPRQQIEAYVAGVNAFLSQHGGSRLPPEFTLLHFEPEPWTGPDVIVWAKMMAWDLSENYAYELLRRDLLTNIGPERTAQLLPPLADSELTILSESPAAPASDRPPPSAPAPASGSTTRAQDEHSWSALFSTALSSGHPAVRNILLGGGRSEGLGSNNWVVGGALTASGRPLLANDPHLATHVPSLWYLAHMSAGEFDVIGATLPGGPAVVLGRNRFIAWGATNAAADVQDLYRELIDPTGRFAEFRGSLEPLRFVRETILVKGGAPVEFDVRISRHGPLISDAINANNADATGQAPVSLEPLALRWTALDEDDRTVAAFQGMNEARNWSDFTAALRDFVVPSQNFVYADVEGHIGYYAPGRVPIRARGNGAAPGDGWTGEMEWVGWIPFEALPHAFDPPDHVIVTANNRPVPADYPYLLTVEHPNAYRARRITDLVRSRTGLTADDFRAIQADTFSSHAQALLPILLEHVRPTDPADRQAVDLLTRWNYQADAESAAAPIFQAWFLRLPHALAGDDLGPRLVERYEGRFSRITRFVIATLSSSDTLWCDEVTTADVRETCAWAVTRALHEGVQELTQRFGADMSRWRWGAMHRAVFPHQGLDSVGLLRPLLSRSIPSAGDWSTVNVGSVSVDSPFEQRAIPGYRQIIDLSPANDSRFQDAVGQSGHFLSPHYDDFLPDWQAVRHRRMRMERQEIEQRAIGHLRIVPPPRPQ